MKPREWWIDLIESDIYESRDSAERHQYDRMVNVIEKSAYDDLKAENDKYKNWLPSEQKPSEKKLSAEVNRLFDECRRLQNLLDKARLELDRENKRADYAKKSNGENK